MTKKCKKKCTYKNCFLLKNNKDKEIYKDICNLLVIYKPKNKYNEIN